MKKYFVLLNNRGFWGSLVLLLSCFSASAQNNVGINNATPHASAVLDVSATDKGVLLPRMTSAQRGAIASPAEGLIVYQTDGVEGFYVYDGSTWGLIGGNNYWTASGANIYRNSGNLGIGTVSPTVQLDVLGGSVSFDNYIYLKDFDMPSSTNTSLISRDGALLVWSGGFVVGHYGDNLVPAAYTATGTMLSTGASAFAVNSGNVGIGIDNPNQKLQVAGGNIGWGNSSTLNIDQGGSIELGGTSVVAGTGLPFIDFHYTGLAQDYNTRIHNDGDGVLTFIAPTYSRFSGGVRMAGLGASASNTLVLTRNASGDLETRTLPANIWDGDDVNDADADPSNELQSLSLSGSNLSLSGGGGTIDLSAIDTDTDDQTLSLSGTTLSIVDGNSVNLAGINTDAQTLSLSGTNLSITGGNTVALAGLQDNLGNHIATQNIQLGNYWLSGNGANAGVYVSSAGNVGVGTSSPDATARLHVDLGTSNSRGFLVSGTFGTGSVPDLGAGSRMMFYPGKAAFRAGNVTGTQWDNANTGLYSMATGVNTTASGSGSVAMGLGTIASGSGATALGFQSQAIANYSFAAGKDAGAMSTESVAIGSSAIAYELYSIALGLGTASKSRGEIAIGTYNTDATPSNPSIFSANNRLFVIGNGGGDTNRSDALVILRSGDTSLKGRLTLTNGVSSYTLPNADGIANQVLRTNGAGTVSWGNMPSGDNLGNHTATQLFNLGNNWLSGDGDAEGLTINGTGSVAIGMANNGSTYAAKLHIYTGSSTTEGFLVRAITNSGGGTVPNLGAGARMMFYPGKAAFRAGDVTGTQWDNANTGSFSTATGRNTIASGGYSIAMGISTIASGDYSVALGNTATASNRSSTAIGESANSSNAYASAIGYLARTSGLGAFAAGYGPIASGNYSSAIGEGTTASGNHARTMGTGNTASGYASMAMGHVTTARAAYETVLGIYNTGYTPFSTTNYNSADRLFVIGNGQSPAALSDALVMLKNGNMGLGTSTPTKAKLEIVGTVNNTPYTDYGRLISAGTTNAVTGAGAQNISLYASGIVAASEFQAFSDARIKNIQGISKGEYDLQTLLHIEITDYTLRDSLGKGNAPIKKVIGQQVAAVFPQAVTLRTDIVPDIYRLSSLDSNGCLVLANHQLQAGDTIQLLFEKHSELARVNEVMGDSLMLSSRNQGTVFVYGRQVHDFHTVDYEAIAMLNVSATQELARRLIQAENESKALRAEIAKSQIEQNRLLQQQQAQDARLKRLEALLDVEARE